jgi:hypothetical protein
MRNVMFDIYATDGGKCKDAKSGARQQNKNLVKRFESPKY